MAWNNINNPTKIHSSKKAISKNNFSYRPFVWVGIGVVFIASAVYCFYPTTPKEKIVKEKPKREISVRQNRPPKVEKKKTEFQNTVKAEPKIDMKSLTVEERQKIQMDKIKERGIDLSVQSNRVVRTGTEQIMAWIFTTEVGELPPPLPKIPDYEMAHLADILLSKNPINESDTDATADAKQTVELAKKELISYIEKGGTPKEFFDYYRGQLVQAYETRKTMRQSVMKILREEPALALEYLEECNNDLEKRGIKKITLHPKQLKHFGITQD